MIEYIKWVSTAIPLWLIALELREIRKKLK